MTKKTRERLGKLLLFAHGYLCLMPPLVIITYSAAIESHLQLSHPKYSFFFHLVNWFCIILIAMELLLLSFITTHKLFDLKD